MASLVLHLACTSDNPAICGERTILPIRPDVPPLLAQGFIKLCGKFLILEGVGDKDVAHAPI